MMIRMLNGVKINSCPECPARNDKESHGPCDSDYWGECKLLDNRVIPDYYKGKFPKFCPLEKSSTESDAFIVDKVWEALKEEGKLSYDERRKICDALTLLDRRISGVPVKSKVMQRLKIKLSTE